jgi:hypothetical protein
LTVPLMLTPLLTIAVVNSGVVHNMLLYPGFMCTSKEAILRKKGGGGDN